MVSKAAYLGILLAAFTPGLCGTTFAQGGGSIVINEILASNLSDVRDPQGQHEDWIELYNLGNTPVDLAGYFLTDDLARPTKWQFPAGNPSATTIPARGYLLIWADGDIADSGLHAGFRLSGEGEVVALFAPDGLTMLDSLAFGPLEPDVSYGRYPDGAADLRFFGYPTAGWSNLVIYQGVVSPPQFDVGSQICTRPVTVTLTTATEGASIYYTTDGTEPFSEARNQPVGSLYTKPVVIGGTVTLKAMAVKAGWRRSLTKAERYVFVGQDVQAFSSPLAIAVVDTFGKGVSRTPVPAYGCFLELEEEGRAR
ncbi:MAG TPA: lamin tail domain-containing protein, partial [Sedimentisphaerales bacterium]|nr:lamin tail domain-containing protein [Sedimentisphaerales bacterium]